VTLHIRFCRIRLVRVAGDGFSRLCGAARRPPAKQTVSVNRWRVIFGTKEFLPHLLASGDGHVINRS
jgi:NADP-dependent 3-hydroxy acid dehydrogenase YdfG